MLALAALFFEDSSNFSSKVGVANFGFFLAGAPIKSKSKIIFLRTVPTHLNKLVLKVFNLVYSSAVSPLPWHIENMLKKLPL